jgi:hypothetical protein
MAWRGVSGHGFFFHLLRILKMQLIEMTETMSRVAIIKMELEKIRDANPDGLLTTEATVESATVEDSPIHCEFTWDNEIAGHQHRLTQARTLIRMVKVINPSDVQKRSVPKYISLMTDRHRDGGGYRETNEVIQDQSLLAQLEETAHRELEAWLRRNAILTELCAIVKAAADGAKPKPKRKRRRG